VTVNQVRSFFTQGGGGSQDENELLATVPSGAVLTAIDVTGQLSTESVAGTPAVSVFEPLNLMTGLQYVASGGTPTSIVNIPIGTGSWLTFAEGFSIPPTPQFWVQTTTYVQYVVFGFKERWRGVLPVPSAIDVYWSFGENQALSDTVGYRSFAAFKVEWATFP
jgi:hypothetical protein